MTWEGLVTKYHNKHSKEIGLDQRTEAYIQFLVLKKTLESISFERRRGLEENDKYEDISALIERLEDVKDERKLEVPQE